MCQGVIEDSENLFYPYNCKVHKKCIKEWVAKVIEVCVCTRVCVCVHARERERDKHVSIDRFLSIPESIQH